MYRVLSVTPKSGRQGDFVLMQAETRLYDDRDTLALVELQDLVYRDAVVAPERVNLPSDRELRLARGDDVCTRLNVTFRSA